MIFCVYHSFFQLASFYRIELFQPCIKAFPYRHFYFQTSVFSLFRSKVTELLFQKEKLVAVCQTNFSRNQGYDNVLPSREKSAVSPGTAQSGRRIWRKYRAVCAYRNVPPDIQRHARKSVIDQVKRSATQSLLLIAISFNHICHIFYRQYFLLFKNYLIHRL